MTHHRIIAHPTMDEPSIDALASQLDLIPIHYRTTGKGAGRVALVRRPSPMRTALRMMQGWTR